MTNEPPPGWESSAHPGFERLAELEEGLLDPADAARVSDHAAGCTECRAQQAELERTRSLLGALPVEGMPADVAARLDRALAGADSPRSTTVVPLQASRRRWTSRPLAAGLGAAAATVAVVVALVVTNNSGGQSTGGAAEHATAAGAGSAANSVLDGLTTTASGTNYTAGNLATTVPQLVGTPAATMSRAAPGGSSGDASTRTSTPRPLAAAGTSAPTIPAALRRLHDSPAALQNCVLGVEAGGRVQRPLAIDFARYQGAPAVLVVLPGLSAGFVDAWFVGPACSKADAHLLGYKAISESGSSPASSGG